MGTLSRSSAIKSIYHPLPTGSNIKKRSRAVTFVSETNFELGRPQEKYYRGFGPRRPQSYEAGEHAASAALGLEDGSMMSNTMYNWEQPKVVAGSASMVRAFMGTYDIPDRHEGIAQHHPRYEEIAGLMDNQRAEKPEWLENKLKGAEFLLLAINNDRIAGYAFHGTRDIEDDDYYLDEHEEESSDDGLGDVDASIDDLEPLNKLNDGSDSSESSDSGNDEMGGLSPTWSFRPKANPAQPDLVHPGIATSAKPSHSNMWEDESAPVAHFRDDRVEAKVLMDWYLSTGESSPHPTSPSINGFPVAGEHTNGMEQADDEREPTPENVPELATDVFKSGEKRSANENFDVQNVKRARNTTSEIGMNVEPSH